jgi:predicted nucleic acid-binding protein
VSEALDPGERAAIALAERMRADLVLIDEAAGRAEARRRRIRVTGTLGVLLTAAEAGWIDVSDTLARLRATNFYVDDELLREVFGRWIR